MITTRFQGGLGNQLFQYAIARCLANKWNTELKFDITLCDDEEKSHHAFYRLGIFNVRENFATPEEFKNSMLVKESNELNDDFWKALLEKNNDLILEGFWQNEKYFAEIRDILLEEFTLKNPLEKNSSAWREKILSANCAVSLHVRHGDFLLYHHRKPFGVISAAYYFKCVEELRKDYPDITVFVFSDDLDWCKEHLQFDIPTEFVEGCEHAFEEMHLMSLCKHNIISNSTFAWWGAWLNKNPDKKVWAPYPWHVNGFQNKIIPESWIKIPVEYNSDMSPMLSIILYVKNDKKILPIILTEILSQTFTDYELIIVNVSTDESGKICRQFAQNDNVTVIRVKPSTNKFIAWNKGLSVANGDYVLFLAGKNFIFPHTALLLSNISASNFGAKAMGPKRYLTYANFDNYTPNVICTTQYLAEDDGGGIGLNELPNKIFSIHTDAAFQNLPNMFELNLSAEQKLMLLASKQINKFVGTKFFKRKFLYENKITFKEKAGGGMDAELLFAVETFLATEKITFVPQVFSGRLK